MTTFQVVLLSVAASLVAARNLTFPDGFVFGASTSAYQVEGAWNTSGKGENIWDRMLHERHAENSSQPTGDVTADSYHHYKEDVKAAKDMGLNFYRFSISWARILPKGDLSVINQDGIDYYNNLINELLKNNITPVVTVYHWDLPQHLQDLGGLVNDIIIDYFEDYARLLFTHFGDRVKWWITFNEPGSFIMGYSTGQFPPNVVAPGVGEYLVIHNMLKAHARVYHLYNDTFRSQQNGKVSITLSIDYPIPKTNSTADIEATEKFFQFNLGWYAHPIYSTEGDYPAIMKETISNNSKAEGLQRSRLPEFGEHWVKYIRGTYDFYAMNFYSSKLISASNTSAGDIGNVAEEKDPSWPYGPVPMLRYTPFGMRGMLKMVSDAYNHPPILITENGWCDNGEINDTMRIRYLVNYYAAVLDAIYLDDVNVIGHITWALIDNFEWFTYSTPYGLYHVDFSDPQRTRTPKESARVIASITRTRQIPEQYLDKE